MTKKMKSCAICLKPFEEEMLFPVALLHPEIRHVFETDHHPLDDKNLLCKKDLHKIYGKYKISHFENHQRRATPLTQLILDTLQSNKYISTNLYEEDNQPLTFGERLADQVASFGGCWAFIILLSVTLGFWVFLNTSLLFSKHFDPYPYILLNLVLSFIATFQAPIILMSQNRQESRDRERSQNDYMINLKAEIEIRQIEEKLDFISKKLWEKMEKIDDKIKDREA